MKVSIIGYSGSGKSTLAAAFGRWVCLRRVVSRFVRYRGQTRDSMGEGCVEKIDLPFLCWVLKDGRTKDTRQRYAHVLHTWPRKARRIANQRELNDCYRQYDLTPLYKQPPPS